MAVAELMNTETITVTTERPTSEALHIFFNGRLDAISTGSVWEPVLHYVQELKPTQLIVNANELRYCDGAGIALLVELKTRQTAAHNAFLLRGLRPQFQILYDMVSKPIPLSMKASRPLRFNQIETIGVYFVNLGHDLLNLITFIGELSWNMMQVLMRPSRIRWKDFLLVMERAGVDACPIIVMTGFLVGLIMAFQSAIPMRQFGADIFVADLVALSMLRELGPLITAILLAGRSGSAFAAELGTMKVNEEINALHTMGLDPVRLLVTSRVLALFFLAPLLTVCANLAAFVGCAVVMKSLGYPFVTFVNQVLQAVSLNDFLGGFIKAFFFGVLVAGVGCLRGLQTKTGASAVGVSTTRAVVSAIILIIVVDGVFSIIYYYLGI